MNKFRAIRSNRPGAGRSMPVRPQRAVGLTAPTVGIVLGSSGTHTNMRNAYLTAAHVAIGLLTMTLSLEDILLGGPTRPAIIPFTGAYMATAVIFFVGMKERRPIVLAWTLALSDAILLTALYNLTILNIAGSHELTMGLASGLVFIVYGFYGIPKLSVVVSLTAICGFLFGHLYAGLLSSGPAGSDVAGLLTVLIAAGFAAVAVRIAFGVRYRAARRTIGRLQFIDETVSMHRTARGHFGN